MVFVTRIWSSFTIILFALSTFNNSLAAAGVEELRIYQIGEIRGSSMNEAAKNLPIFGKLMGEVETGRILAVHASSDGTTLYYRGKSFEFGPGLEAFKFNVETTAYELDLRGPTFQSYGVNSQTTSKKRNFEIDKIYVTNNNQAETASLANENEKLAAENLRLGKDVSDLNTKVKDLNKLVVSLQAVTGTSKNEGACESNQGEDEVQELAKELQQTKAALGALDLTAEAFKQANAELSDENKTLTDRLAETAEECALLESQNEILQAELANALAKPKHADEESQSKSKNQPVEKTTDKAPEQTIGNHRLSISDDDLTGRKTMLVVFDSEKEKFSLAFRCNFQGSAVYQSDWVVLNNEIGSFDADNIIKYRFNNEEMQSAYWSLSTSREAAFVPERQKNKFTNSMSNNQRFAFSTVTFLGNVLSDTAVIDGFGVDREKGTFCPCLSPKSGSCG